MSLFLMLIDNACGLMLGQNIHNIRVNGVYSEHIDRLEALDVNFEVKST